ncbi:MAG: HDOD domain-containing protein, partial [Desulfamplus sp.]|nr:HDOD domain-containing protein [Desulfamplus sp.]
KMDNNLKAEGGLRIELDLLELPDLPELDDDEDFSKTAAVQIIAPEDNYEQVRLSNILEDLDKKMKSGRFLHTFTAQIEEINRVIKMKYASTRDIASVILKDVALASRVLSIVNSCYYGQFSQRGVTSISEAMVILGTEEVQQAAATLLLFEFMRDISKSELLKEKSLASLMRGMMAKEIAQGSKYKEVDEFQLVAMLYDIGEQIMLFCDPEAYQRIRKISETKGVDRELVAKKLIGASFSQIGQGIVSGWGFPKSVVDCIKPFKEFATDPKMLTLQNLKRLVASFTDEMCNIDWRKSEIVRQQQIEDIVRRYSNFLNIGISGADELLNSSIKKVENHAKVLRVNLRNSRFDRKQDVSVASATFDQSQQTTWQSLEDRLLWIENQIEKIEEALVSNFKLSELLHLIVTTIYKGFFFSRISICVMNKSKGIMAVRFVLGKEPEMFSKDFQFVVSDGDDTFNKSLTTGLDIIVEDISDKSFNSRIPEWYIKGSFADSFALYPVVVEQKKVGLIYVDWDKSQTHLFTDQIKYLMQRLKALTVTAIKKSRQSSKTETG